MEIGVSLCAWVPFRGPPPVEGGTTNVSSALRPEGSIEKVKDRSVHGREACGVDGTAHVVVCE
jgi:hypothetical protein